MANGRARHQEENWLRDGVNVGVGKEMSPTHLHVYRLAVDSRSHITDHDSESG